MNIVKCSVRTSIILTVIPCPKGMCKVKVKHSRSFTHFDKRSQIYMDDKQETNKPNFDTDSTAPDGPRGADSSHYSLQNVSSGSPIQQESITISYQHPSFFSQYPCRLPVDNHYYYWHSLYNSWLYHLANPVLSPFTSICTPQNSFRRYFHRPHDEVVRVPIPGVEDTAIMSLRRWEKLVEKPDRKPGFIFTLMSYNVLAQDLLQWHPHLYKHHDPRYLSWEKRWRNLLTEIQEFDPDILCLQEVQESHIKEYYSSLESLGYQGVYKKRTGQRTDGCAIYYKTENVTLLEHVTVEFYQKNVPILNRDNVGIVAKFTPKLHPTREFVVATTHLLYNPRRTDVRLAQMQVFLSEVERISYKKDSAEGEPRYVPILITGDFNTPPKSDLYNFMVEGKIKYDNMPPGLLDNGSQVLVTSVLGISGRIISQEWEGCPYILNLNPLLFMEDGKPKPYERLMLEKTWSDDMELLSKYLDYKTRAELKMKTYMSDHPEVKDILGDYVNNIIMLKPDNIIAFTMNYFQNLFPIRIAKMGYFEKPNEEHMLEGS